MDCPRVFTEIRGSGNQLVKEESSPQRRTAQPARLFAKKKSARGMKGTKTVRQPNERCEGRVPVSTQPLDSDNLSTVAAHCNERKTAAKACSVSFKAAKPAWYSLVSPWREKIASADSQPVPDTS